MKKDEIIKIDEYAGQMSRVAFNSDYDFDQFIEDGFWSQYADFSGDKTVYIPANLAKRLETWASKNDVDVEIGSAEPNKDADLRGGEEPEIEFTPDELMRESKGRKMSKKKINESVISFKEDQDYMPGEGAMIVLKNPKQFSLSDPEISISGMGDVATLNEAMNKIIEMAKMVKVQTKNNFVENMRDNMEGIQSIKEMCEGLMGFNEDMGRAKGMHQNIISAAMMGEKAFDNPLAEGLPFLVLPAGGKDSSAGLNNQEGSKGKVLETFNEGVTAFLEMFEKNKGYIAESGADGNIAGWTIADFEDKVQKLTAPVDNKTERVGPYLLKVARVLAQFQKTLSAAKNPQKMAKGAVVRDTYEQLQAGLQILRGIAKYSSSKA